MRGDLYFHLSATPGISVDFFEDAFPRLEKVCTLNMIGVAFRERSGGAERCPPILRNTESVYGQRN